MKILPIWQPVGFSTNLIAQRVGELYGVKTSHTGTIDPMAAGVIVVLLGEERLKKYEYAKWLKNYEFHLIFGISTDSYDCLGIVENLDLPIKIDAIELKKILRTFIGNYKQKIPPLSTKKIKGKHLHEYFRSGEHINLPEKCGKIYKLKLNSIKNTDSKALVKKIMKNIALVTGDFRQKEITRQWNTLVKQKKLPKKIMVAKMETKTSKGIYIRSLTQDIAEKMSTIGIADEIIRTKNGKYSKKDCKTLEEIFGKNYQKVYDFSSKYKFTVVK